MTKHFKKLSLALIVLSALALGACINIGAIGGVRPSRDIETREFDLTAFNAIDIGGVADITFRQSNTHRLVATMNDNLFDILDIYVVNNTLSIEFSRSISGGRIPQIEFVIYAPTLTAASFPGAVNVTNWDVIDAANFRLSVSGAANVDIDFDVNTLDVGVSGAASVNLGGRADMLYFNATGATQFNAQNLQATNADIQMSGAGSATVFVTDNLDVSISGVATVRYLGNPDVTSSVSGLGSVQAY